MSEVEMATSLAGLRMETPVMAASGTFGFGREYSEVADLSGIGAIVVKGVTLEPREGNPGPRVVETPAGMLNSVGLQNPGVEAFARDEMPFLRGLGIPVVVNIAGRTVEEYVEVARLLDSAEGVHALEVNVSCPNVKEGGMAFGHTPDSLSSVVGAVRRRTTLPLMVKLSPNAGEIAPLARAAERAGADSISLINTLKGMAIDVESRRPVLGALFGGLSGPAIRPVALRMVWEAYEAVDLPIVGMGGIMCGRDALEFILAGATAVAVGTASFVRPDAAQGIAREMCDLARKLGCASISELTGAAHA